MQGLIKISSRMKKINPDMKSQDYYNKDHSSPKQDASIRILAVYILLDFSKDHKEMDWIWIHDERLDGQTHGCIHK